MPNKQKDSQPTDKTQSRIEKCTISEKTVRQQIRRKDELRNAQ